MEFIIPSYAKINWGLWLLGRRPDGYHEIFTPIQKITLSDIVRIRPSSSLSVETSNGIPQRDNFVYKGLLLFEEKTGIKPLFEIFIEKHIPVGSGLGGGSSNLATILDFVNRYFGSPLTREELIDLVAQISSDAPSFFCKGIAIATGKGERVKCVDIPTFKGIEITLFVPKGISSPTGEIYSKTTPEMFVKSDKILHLEKLLLRGDPKKFFEISENPLGEIFLKLHPTVAEDIDFLQRMCYKKFLVSGSGSSFYTVGSFNKGCFKGLDRLKRRYKIFSLVTI